MIIAYKPEKSNLTPRRGAAEVRNKDAHAAGRAMNAFGKYFAEANNIVGASGFAALISIIWTNIVEVLRRTRSY